MTNGDGAETRPNAKGRESVPVSSSQRDATNLLAVLNGNQKALNKKALRNGGNVEELFDLGEATKLVVLQTVLLSVSVVNCQECENNTLVSDFVKRLEYKLEVECEGLTLSLTQFAEGVFVTVFGFAGLLPTDVAPRDQDVLQAWVSAVWVR